MEDVSSISYASPEPGKDSPGIELEFDPKPDSAAKSIPMIWSYEEKQERVEVKITVNASEEVRPGNYSFSVSWNPRHPASEKFSSGDSGSLGLEVQVLNGSEHS